MISSRAFSPKVLSSVVEASRLGEDSGVSVFLPLIDLPNHRPLAKVEWRAGSSDVGMVVLEEIGPGQEISNNYGPRNNEQCLSYGPADNLLRKLLMTSSVDELRVLPSEQSNRLPDHQIRREARQSSEPSQEPPD